MEEEEKEEAREFMGGGDIQDVSNDEVNEFVLSDN